MENWRMQEFSINDLESFTGVKAHTIRIWEQRYGLLEPRRTDTNIRVYSDLDLKKLINVSLLNRNGHKISAIVEMPESQFKKALGEVGKIDEDNSQVIDKLKLAMLEFDEQSFSGIVKRSISATSVSDVFESLLVPFLDQVGILWQTSTICPAHEHFVSNLIRQIVCSATNQLPEALTDDSKPTYVLFLPTGEVHELGLLMVHYRLRLAGLKCVYLGQSLPIDDLSNVRKSVGRCAFVTHLTKTSVFSKVLSSFESIGQELNGEPVNFYMSGNGYDATTRSESVMTYSTAKDLVEAILKDANAAK
jgi:MerR family transcriptional regulator, light-induced transcriptional regulator